MPQYLKHKYSKRVWEVKTDHGPDCPYLEQFPHVRLCKISTMEKFFSPCPGPTQDSPIRVTREIEWEKSQSLKAQPLVVTPPKNKRPISQRRKNPHGGGKEKSPFYTLKDLCQELRISPSVARRLLRSHGKKPPEGGWKWFNPQEADPIKKFLKKLI